MLDIFNSNAFGVVSLTDAINQLKFVPGRIGSLGLFAEGGVTTTSVGVEEKGGILSLVAPTPRGGPGQTLTKSRRTLRQLPVPHFQIDDAMMAEEVQGVRAFGSEDMVEVITDMITERQQIHSQSHEATIEYSRIGAIKGIVTYADGSTTNLFTEFGVSQEAEIDFDLDNASPAAGVLRKACASVIRTIAATLDGIPLTGLHAFCGDAFFDDLIAHKEVRETYLNQTGASELRGGYIQGGQSYGVFDFGGIRWENYRGAVGSTAFIDTDKCHIFPVGVPGLFKTYFAPADYMETVNTRGRRLYNKMWQMANDKGVHFESQTNALSICTRPKVLIKGKRT